MDFGIVSPATKVTYADIPQNELKVIEDVGKKVRMKG